MLQKKGFQRAYKKDNRSPAKQSDGEVDGGKRKHANR